MHFSSHKPFLTIAVTALAVALLASCSTVDTGKAEQKEMPKADNNATLSVNFGNTKQISDTMFGIFFEDINYAADGGLYAELVRNRDFEFSQAIGDGRGWNAKTAWSLTGSDASFDIAEDDPISENNKHYAVLNVTKPGAALVNEGFRGIPLKKGAKYDFSVFAKNFGTEKVTLVIKLIDDQGKIYGTTQVKVKNGEWKTLTATIKASEDCKSAKLSISPSAGKVGLDMVSLFPRDTFKGRKNGLRKDLAQALADLKPKFIRFPGGCVAHGSLPTINGKPHSGLIENAPNCDMYYWKDSVGELKDRVPIHNRWGYHQTRGLGYFEYMQFCEDIGATPLPILPCGVDCQFTGGQQAVPLDEMPLEVQNVLDLVEFANGPVTTKWGKLRADMGHRKPFNLKYIGLGNEEQITENFRVRFKMIYDALKEKHPEITVVGTVGPSAAGGDFNNGWNFARQENIPIVDEHFYQPPEWFVNSGYHRYDKYDRNGTKVYAGEYAAHERGQQGHRRNTIETALDEAVFLTGVERNGDVVAMSSYAPLFSKENDTQWYPDMIVFNNNEIIPTTTYEVHKLFSANAGTVYVDNSIKFGSDIPADYERYVVSSVVRDGKNGKGDIIIKLVNVSAKDFNISIDLSDFDGKIKENAVCESITGTWKDTKFTMSKDNLKVSKKNLTVFSKGGSMSMIRLKVK